MSRLTHIFLPSKAAKQPLKRSLTGYETENFIIDHEGKLDSSDSLIKAAGSLDVEKEAAKSMIETVSLPSKRLQTSSQNLVRNLLRLDELAEKEERYLYPFGTYFWKNDPVFRRKRWYTIQAKLLGEERWKNAGMCCGFHQHYTLPRGVFDHKARFIQKKRSKINKPFIDSYNFLTALDPILTTIAQSSPYVDGKHLAKDSRLLMYRGGKFLGYSKGMYTKRRLFGALSSYKMTVSDLSSTLRRRQQKWKSLMEEQGFDTSRYITKTNTLKFTWNPVKVNPHGTLEYRGADMNMLSNLFAAATMLKFSLRKIQQDFLVVVPLDIKLEECFSVENNMVFIPPFSQIRTLQKRAAYEGLANDDVYIYVKRFYRFVRKLTYKHYHPLLSPVKRMLDRKETASDRIMSYFARKGDKEKLTADTAREGAVKFSKDFRKDLYKTAERLDKIEI